ncbi:MULTISPECIES: CDGSH iron-sulfur domain-containing protein [Marinobacter]|uniref:CDGSH iron-sulfur domain-containing protein n=1 Tax=Marinobacter suaedae TaxID=3057675 RepID=A0ABT8VZB3_9GAMM|nr:MULTISPECIES: CDGSH iron-sulfur domain-containing protein [unclassified Marinobacter]MBZ2169403.1 CDGSH iron-sulfur domain-containing protein [Marinobacter sp. F4216]MDO3721268.1 CDGSH iron-sulfur domain-containing protein [Marinobacter sp. chi1]
MADEKPHIARKTPCSVLVEPGKNYMWCACGRSEKQPFCDGSHKGTGFTPVKYTAEKEEWVWFCGCKQTGNPPLCDGTHKTLD